jgi:hypothetical protein
MQAPLPCIDIPPSTSREAPQIQMGRPVGRDVNGGFVEFDGIRTHGHCSGPRTGGANRALPASTTPSGASAETPTGRQIAIAASDIPTVDMPNETTTATKTVHKAIPSHLESGRRGQGPDRRPLTGSISSTHSTRSAAAPLRRFLAERTAEQRHCRRFLRKLISSKFISSGPHDARKVSGENGFVMNKPSHGPKGSSDGMNSPETHVPSLPCPSKHPSY